MVCRHERALLFVATPDPVLVGAFATSEPGAELQALASATVAAGFDVGPFVALAWNGGLRVMVFGDIALETDRPSLPMLSGAGSRTWVEHTVALPDGHAMVEVTGAAADAATDLVAGTVFAGGFRLELGVTAATARAEEAQARVDETIAVPRLPEPEPIAAEPESEPEAEPAPRTPPDVDADDPVAALAAIQAAAVGADGEPLQPAGVLDPPAEPNPAPAPDPAWPGEAGDPDVTLPPPVSDVLLADVRGADDSRASLVDAKLCPQGHANPPTAATCAVCGEFLAPGTSAVVHVPRPSLGRLELDDGTIVDLDHEPDRARLRRVKTPGDKVSRTHLEVRFQGWDVLVADLGSTNGTFVVPHPGGQVGPLESGRAQLVEPGAVVYFGSRSFTVLGRDAS
jgi:hypothetical protein